MVLGMVLPVVACFALVRLGICPLVPLLAWLSTDNLYSVAQTSMLLGMIAVMIWRRAMYSRAGHGIRMAGQALSIAGRGGAHTMTLIVSGRGC